jgi:hypothetical protein
VKDERAGIHAVARHLRRPAAHRQNKEGNCLISDEVHASIFPIFPAEGEKCVKIVKTGSLFMP